MSLIGLYDYEGRPISHEGWVELFNDPRRRVAVDVIGDVEVSTVWLGLDHGFAEGPPLIYETMTFSDDEQLHLWRRLYPSRELAEHGHELVCRELAGVRPGERRG